MSFFNNIISLPLCYSAFGFLRRVEVLLSTVGCTQRLRLYAVRDCGLLSCPHAPKFERGRMLELSLKTLLHIAFVRAMCIIFLEVFKYKFHNFVFTQTDFFFVPNFRFRCHFLNFSLLFKMVIRISFLAKWFVSNRTIV